MHEPKSEQGLTFKSYFVCAWFLILSVLGVVLPEGPKSLIIHIMALCIFAMAYDISLGYTALCSLGHAVFFGMGAYIFVYSILKGSLGFLLSLLLSLVGGLTVGILVGLISVRLTEAYFVIVTAVIYSIFHLLALNLTWLTGGDDGISVEIPGYNLGVFYLSVYNKSVNYYLVLLVFMATYLFLDILTRSKLGKVLVAIRENEKRASFLGYNVFHYKLSSFAVSAAFSALAGGIYALSLRYASADFFSFHWSILPVVWCLIGGLGTLYGSWIGVSLMYLFQYYVSSWWHFYLLIFGVLILFILRYSKGGIVGYIMERL
ncbi:MAG: branched-chain amino acid ABC transporter permease [candidate division WOR-3 bacterium]